MYLEGSEYVTYTPVEAYGVSAYADGVISGGNSGDNFVAGSTRFLWVYDPDNPGQSGFTGCGQWFCGRPNTPLEGIANDETLKKQFEEGRKNLNYEFQIWQSKVASETPNSYVQEFIVLIALANGGDIGGCAVTVSV